MKVFLLEDDAIIREVVCEYLQAENYTVVVAEDGNKALEIIKQQSFDIAVLDIMVPYVNGFEVLAYLQQEEPKTPAIMLTALDDEKSQLKAYNLLADDYIVKPFSPVILIKRIQAVLRRVHTTAVKENGLVIDEQGYQVFYNGKSLGVTITEFILLETLHKRPEQVYTREQLLDAIAPDDFTVSDRVVDAHIKNLRKKLPHPFIQTITGVGYKWRQEAEHEAIQ